MVGLGWGAFGSPSKALQEALYVLGMYNIENSKNTNKPSFMVNVFVVAVVVAAYLAVH